MGSGTSTHVANGYNKTIYVKCDAERRYVTMSSYNCSAGGGYGGASAYVSSGGSGTYDWNKITAGFSKIMPGEYIKYDVDCSGTTKVYISVIAEDGEVICDALPKKEDYSVMVNARCQLKDVEYGTIWTPR